MRRTPLMRRWAGRLLVGCAVVAVAGASVLSGSAGAAPAAGAPTVGMSPRPAQPEPDPETGNEEPPPGEGSAGTEEPGPATAAAPRPRPAPPRPRPDDARERAAEQARDRAEAAERAAERAAAAEKVQVSWESRGRPARMVVMRPQRVDLVTGGRLTRSAPHRDGPVTLGALDRYLPDDWLTIADGTALLAAAVVMTPGATMDVGGDVRTVKLAGGGLPSDAASIYTGGGRLILRGVTVTSADPVTQLAVPPNAAGRPGVVVSSGGRLESTDSTISDLGTPPGGLEKGRAGVLFNPGSSGHLVRTAVLRNSTGVQLSKSDAVHLDDVTITGSTMDGLVLKGDRGTTMSRIRSEGNGGNGVLVGGESSDRLITGVSTTGNRAFGVAVVGQVDARVAGIATAADMAGGLRLSRTTGALVTDFTATDQPIGVFTHVNSTATVLDRLRTAGGRRGVVAEKSTSGLEVKASTLDGARVAGIAIGGHDVALNGVQVGNSRTGVRIERGASNVTITGLALNGGDDGLVATPGTAGVVVKDLVANDVGSDAVRTFSPGASIIGGRITGGATGIDIAAATTISGMSISGSDEGIHSRSTELVHADRITIDAVSLGINTAPGSPFLLSDSSVNALEALRGDVGQRGVNELSLPPLNLLGAIGVPLILLALGLELVHSLRQRGLGGVRRVAPPVPVGAT